jgi:glycosyltransferase involved in cell wall biosynthesis
MRILHIIPSLSGGGAERQLSYLAPELVLRGHEVHIAYNQDGPDKPELPNIILHLFKHRSNYNPYILWQLIQLVRQIKPDIIQTWILQTDILGGIISKLTGIPWIFREPSSTMGYIPNWKNRLRIRVASGARGIISNSQGGDLYWKNVSKSSRRYIVSNGLPITEIDNLIPDMPNGIPKPEVPIILFVGRLIGNECNGEGNKNLISLIKAIALIIQQKKTICFLCGDGPQRQELEILAHDLDIEKYVIFLGHIPAVSIWKLMKTASVFVSLSTFEGCPNTVMEAMACNCPLVVSDIPAHHEILDEKSALFVNQTNIREIASAVISVLNDGQNVKTKAINAKAKTREWSIKEMTTKYENIYGDVVNNR